MMKKLSLKEFAQAMAWCKANGYGSRPVSEGVTAYLQSQEIEYIQ